MRPRQPQRDLSQQGGNPTSELQKNYEVLMGINDPDELAQAAVQVVRPLVGRGFSEKNYTKFMQNLEQAQQRGVQGLQKFLTNYILKGSGLGVESKEAAVASMLTEDVDDPIELTPYQQHLKALVESYGYHVALLSEMESPDII